MTSVSSIPSWNPSPSRALSAAANKADAAPRFDAVEANLDAARPLC